MDSLVLQTARLSLRPFARTDVDFLYRLWTDPDVRRYLWDDELIPRETAEEVVESSLASFGQHGFGFWTVSLRERDELIGFCGLRHFTDDFGAGPDVEILYGVAPAYWKQGIASEAAQAVLQFGFEQAGLETIQAGADPPNVASIRVMEKLGMRFARQTCIHGLDAVYYACSRAAFRPPIGFG
jgi:ribosomal-protein-alanine N-acetyltransferase